MPTYGELQTEVGQIIIDLPTTVVAQIPTYVKRAVRRLQMLHNFEVMKAESDVLVTTEESHDLASVPSDFKEYRRKPYLINVSGTTYPLEVANDRADVAQLFGDDSGGEATLSELTGRPRAIIRLAPTSVAGASVWEVWPLADALSLYADGNYRIRVPYWKYLPVLSSASDTNWFTENADEWIAYQAAGMAYFNNQDPEGGTYWQQFATQKWNDVLSADKRYKLTTTDTLVPQPRALGPVVGGIRRLGGSFPRAF